MTILRFDGRAWRDRVVVVTGGTSGIGREFAVRLQAEGAKVIACARHEVALRELQTRYPQIEAIRCDVTVSLDVLALEAAIQDRYGRIDVLINNAGIMEQVDLLDQSVSDERIAREIAVNLTGPILLTRRLLPLLRCGRNPMIIMVTSGYALLPATRAPTYSATKAGLRSFTMALRLQLHGVGIRVVEVHPTPGRYAGHALCATAEDLAGNAGRPGVARYCAWAGRDTARKGRPAAVADASGPIVRCTPCCRDMMRHLRIAQWTERRFAILPAILLGASGTRAIATLRSAPVTRQLVSEPDAI